ncbi:MAG: glycosyltransferase [Flavobacteriaceae bacterium]
MRPFLVHVIPTLENAGAETILVRLVEEFDKRGIEQAVLVTKGGITDFFYDKIASYCPVLLWKKEPQKTITCLRNHKSNLKLLGWMYGGIFFAHYMNFRFRLSAELVWNIRQSNFFSNQVKQKGALYLFGLASQLSAPKIIYCAFAAERVHRRFFFRSKRTKVIQNGLAKKESSSGKPNIEIPSKFLLFIGRYDPIKGIDRLLRIVASFFKEHPDYKLIIAGGGWQNDHIPKVLHNQVVLLGNVPFVNELYKKASAYLFTSYFEGFPNVVVEATSNGCPIIAFEAGDAAFILKDYALGQIVTSEKQFLERLFKQTLQPPSQATRQEEAQKQKERFQFKHTVDAYKAFIFED